MSAEYFDSFNSEGLKRMEMRLEQKEEEILSLSEKIISMKDEIEDGKKEIQRLRGVVASLEGKIERQPEKLGIELENKMLRKEIEEMVKMLSKTDQYKQFASKYEIGGLWLVEKGMFSPKSVTDSAETARWSSRGRSKDVAWIPYSVHEIVEDLKGKKDAWSGKVFDSLLFELNQHWEKREEKLLTQQKDKYERKIRDLKWHRSSFHSFKDARRTLSEQKQKPSQSKIPENPKIEFLKIVNEFKEEN